MAARPSPNKIEAAAAEWVVRTDRGELGANEKQEFEAWLSKDSRHYGAYVRAMAAWTSLDRGVVLHPSDLSHRQRPALIDRRRLLVGGAVAASTAAAGLIFAGGRSARPAVYSTSVGEISQVALSDGSTATLDTDSRITVTMQKARRLVRVEHGHVWFEVAKNAARPFVVLAGSNEVRAVGTAFSVRRLTTGTEVMVTEGVVDTRLTSQSTSPALRLVRGGHALLTTDQVVRLATLSSDELERLLAWREGYIAIDGETLLDATAAFNRYNKRKIVIQDPDLAHRRLTGYFRVQDPQGFATAASISLGAKITEEPERIVLTK